MNFLGHTALAQDSSDKQLLGCLIADGIKGRYALEALPLPIRQGVEHHRLVDAIIDTHPEVVNLIKQMPQRRFAPMALDIVWDHCLYLQPAAVPTGGWSSLISRCHYVIETANNLPASREHLLRQMVKGQWMSRYAEQSFMLDAIIGIGKRLRYPQDLSLLCEWIVSHQALLNESFAIIWQDLWYQANWSTGIKFKLC